MSDRWDSWKDSYDEWKLRSPYDEHPYYEDEEPEECDHRNYDLDWQGLCTCDRCGKCWEASAEEVASERRRSEDYDTWCRREERRARYARWFGWLAFWKRWKRKPKPTEIDDDDLPF